MQAAAVTADITPIMEVPLGCGRADGETWNVESRPELNLVALWPDSGPPLVLASVDSLYVGSELRRELEHLLPSVPPENVIFGASHTHAAPMLDATKPGLGDVDVGHMERVKAALRQAVRHLMDPDQRTRATLEASKGKAGHSVNRRFVKRVLFRWPLKFNVRGMRPNFWGRRDEAITTLRLRSEQGKTLAVVWNYACHPVAFPFGRTVSAHYPGVVRDEIRRVEGATSVVFFQGFSGNTRPLYTAEPRVPPGPRHLYRRLRFGPRWLPSTEPRYRQWCESLAQAVSRVLTGTKEVTADSLEAVRLLQDRDLFVFPDGNPVTFQAVRLGTDVGLFAVGGEMMAEYAPLVRRQMGTPFTMCIGCADDVAGYFPTKRMVREGGYESEGFLEPFSLTAVSPEVEANVRAAVKRVTQVEVSDSWA